MGHQISIENDTQKVFSAALIASDSKIIPGWQIDIHPAKTIVLDSKTLKPNEKCKLVIRADSKGQDIQHNFFCMVGNGLLELTCSQIIDGKKLQALELQSLLTQILPGVRIEDHECYGEVFEECFVANELVSSLILYGIAQNTEDAEEMCQHLVDYGVFEPLFEEEPNFKNSLIFFRLAGDHTVVKLTGSLIKSIDSAVTRFRTYANSSCSSPLRDLIRRSLDGWIDKRTRFGFYQTRFFRILDCTEGEKVAYFENTVATRHKGFFYLKDILLVEKRKPKVFQVKAKIQKNRKKTFTFRCSDAKVCDYWRRTLRVFAKDQTAYDLISNSALGVVMNEPMIKDFASRLNQKTFKTGYWVFRQGDQIRNFYLLEKGHMGMYVDRKDRKETYYCTLAAPRLFGEELLYESKIPTWQASYRAEDELQLLTMTPAAIESFFKIHGEDLRKKFKEKMCDNIESAIESVPFFTRLSPLHLALLRLAFNYEIVLPQDVVFYEGEPGHALYVVADGQLEVVQYDAQMMEEVVVHTMEKGDCTGGTSLMLRGVPHTTSVRGAETTLLLTLDEERFKAFLKVAGLDMNIVAREKIVRSLIKGNIPFFEGSPVERFNEIAKVCKIETYKRNEIIFKEGEVADRFFMISYGEVAAIVEGKEISRMGRGKYFGEIAVVVEDTKRTAACKAATQVILISLNKSHFRLFFSDRPEVLAEVELKIAGRRCQIRSILYHPQGVELFTEFLKSQYAEESVEFWHVARAYRKWAKSLNYEDPVDHKRIQVRAREIASKYIGEHAIRQQNISAKMSSSILVEVQKCQASAATFVRAEEEIITLMSRDKLASFKRSGLFDELVELIGGFYEVTQTTKEKGRKKKGGSNIDVEGLEPSARNKAEVEPLIQQSSIFVVDPPSHGGTILIGSKQQPNFEPQENDSSTNPMMQNSALSETKVSGASLDKVLVTPSRRKMSAESVHQ